MELDKPWSPTRVDEAFLWLGCALICWQFLRKTCSIGSGDARGTSSSVRRPASTMTAFIWRSMPFAAGHAATFAG